MKDAEHLTPGPERIRDNGYTQAFKSVFMECLAGQTSNIQRDIPAMQAVLLASGHDSLQRITLQAITYGGLENRMPCADPFVQRDNDLLIWAKVPTQADATGEEPVCLLRLVQRQTDRSLMPQTFTASGYYVALARDTDRLTPFHLDLEGYKGIQPQYKLTVLEADHAQDMLELLAMANELYEELRVGTGAQTLPWPPQTAPNEPANTETIPPALSWRSVRPPQEQSTNLVNNIQPDDRYL